MTYIDAATAVKLPLLRRRAPVNDLGRWLFLVAQMVSALDVSSQQLLGRMCHVTWLVTGLWRASDTSQPVYEQLELARLGANLRQMATTLARYHTGAVGSTTLSLSPDAAVALANLEAWDPTTVATFDTDRALVALVKGTLFR